MENWKRFLKEGAGTGQTRSHIQGDDRRGGFLNQLEQIIENPDDDPDIINRSLERWTSGSITPARSARGNIDISKQLSQKSKADLEKIITDLESIKKEKELKDLTNAENVSNILNSVIEKLEVLKEQAPPDAEASFDEMDDKLRDDYIVIIAKAAGTIIHRADPSKSAQAATSAARFADLEWLAQKNAELNDRLRKQRSPKSKK